MIGYVCKYTPIEIFEGFGEKNIRIEPQVASFDRADALMHPNLCTYAKAVLEEIHEKSLDRKLKGIVLTTCCDSIKRLYDVLKSQYNFGFIHIIDVPRKSALLSANLFGEEIKKLIGCYENFSGKSFDPERLPKIAPDRNIALAEQGINIAFMGARASMPVLKTAERAGASVYNFTCTGDARKSVNLQYSGNLDETLTFYAESLLNSYPCLRMAAVEERAELLAQNRGKISGVIYHTVKFCDAYSFEYACLKDGLDLPILKIETDYTMQCEGQMRTRIEAFIESLKGGKNPKRQVPVPAVRSCLVAGIDSGSTSTNVVIMDADRNIISYSVVRTGARSIDSARKAFEEALRKADVTEKQIAMVVATGYGRVSIPFADLNVTEITCHGKGAHFLNRDVRTIIDIGGQDSKIIRLDGKGEVTDFVMNDKCAAGTGRFLEMMAKTLETSLEDLGKESLNWKEEITITNMCTVFAESEVISLIAQNKERADIIHGLHDSVARRVMSLLGRVGKAGAYMMTGGVAKNIGVVRAIEHRLGEKIFVYEEPEIVGAIGAAIIGLEKLAEADEPVLLQGFQ